MFAMLHRNALKILSDIELKNGQFIKIRVPVKIHQYAKGPVVLVIVLQCHYIIYPGKGAEADFQEHIIHKQEKSPWRLQHHSQ